jgi:NAD(P)-dependent dehydrogenase (short-subunit alcohol dehydrogenase family)
MAGVYETSRSLSADGFETTWAVNVLASFLLTSLLLQSKAVSGSVVTTASISVSGWLPG